MRDFDRICCHGFEAPSDFRRQSLGYMMETRGAFQIFLGRPTFLDRSLIPPD